MDMFFDVLLVGIMVGAIYTLVTIGYSMVYSILKLMNFAHGDVYIFGRARGIIHAGKNGENNSTILALSLELNQIRIGNIFTKSDGQKPRPGVAEKAYIDKDRIIVEEYKYL